MRKPVSMKCICRNCFVEIVFESNLPCGFANPVVQLLCLIYSDSLFFCQYFLNCFARFILHRWIKLKTPPFDFNLAIMSKCSKTIFKLLFSDVAKRAYKVGPYFYFHYLCFLCE